MKKLKKINLFVTTLALSTLFTSNVIAQNYDTYEDGTAIYYNPNTNSKCTKEEADLNVNEYGTSTGIKTGCMKWYTFNDEKGSSDVNIILDHNTTPLVPYNSRSYEDVSNEIREAKEALENDISSWSDNAKSTARLITADEIAKITKAKQILNWDSTTSITGDEWFYFDGADGEDATWQTKITSFTVKSKYGWLFENTTWCTYSGCDVNENNRYKAYNSYDYSVYGYWTQTGATSTTIWRIDSNGRMMICSAHIYDGYGIRPVITISKDILIDKYNIDTKTDNNGTIEIDKKEALEGEKVKITIKANNGHKLKNLKIYKTSDNEDVTSLVSYNSETNEFTMPEYDVTVSAEFEEIIENKEVIENPNTFDKINMYLIISVLGVGTLVFCMIYKRKLNIK